jgi:lincosamide nucleotidyltransferase A/C/D/E
MRRASEASRRTPPRAYRERQPRMAMQADDLIGLLDLLEQSGVIVWLDGGWGVDALLGEQTREHDDVDLIVERVDVPRLAETLAAQGYELVVGAPPGNFVLVDTLGRQVDVHPVAFDHRGGVYLMEEGREWIYPAAGFAGRGHVGGRPVRCLSADVQVLVHAGYELTEKDYRELWLLHERFAVALPAKVREQALASRGD